MADWFMSPSGSDSNNGNSSGTAKKTWNGANAVANSNDRVRIIGGTYSGLSYPQTITKSGVTWQLEPGSGNAVFSGSGSAPSFNWDGLLNLNSMASDVTVAGNSSSERIVFQDSYGRGILQWKSSGQGYSSNLNFKWVFVNRTRQTGIMLAGVNGSNIDDCEFFGCANGGSGLDQSISWWYNGQGHRSLNANCRRTKVDMSYGEGIGALHVDGFLFQDLTIIDCQSMNIYLDNARNGIVERCYSYRNNSRAPGGSGQLLGIANEAYTAQNPVPNADLFPTENVIIRNCIFNGGNGGIQYFVSGGRSGDYYRNLRIYGCEFLNSANYAINFATPTNVGASNGVLRNNIIRGNVTLSGGVSWTRSHNDYPLGNRPSGETGSLVDPPRSSVPAIGAATSAFQISSDSPVKGKGISLTDLPDDFFLSIRPDPPSMGIHEPSGTAPPPPPPPPSSTISWASGSVFKE